LRGGSRQIRQTADGVSTIGGDNPSGVAAEPQEEIAMKGAQKPKKGDKKPAQKTLKEKRQDKRNAAKGNSGLS
jgi:hypothetical protein